MKMKTLARTLLMGAALATGSQAAMAQDIKLRWGHYLAKGPFLEVEQNFAKNIEARTNGKVKIDITYAGGLGKGNEILTLAGRGAIDMASVAPGYYAEQLQFWKAFQIPFVFSSPSQAMKVLSTVRKEFPIYTEELDRMNVNWLFQQPLGVYYMTGPSPDCGTVAGLKGKKIRSFGADVPKAHSAVGAVPVSVRPVEVYEALQRGTIDYSFLNAGNIQQYKLYEPGKYSCGPVMAITGHNVVIGKRAWAKLPADVQKIFMEEAAKSQQEYINWLDAFESKAVENIKAAGGEFIELPASELNKWKAAAPDLLKAWEEEAAGKGHGDVAAKVAARWRELTAN